MPAANVLYTAKATATGNGRDGRTATHDGALDTRLVTPKELGGAGGDGLNPEQLFAAGYAACFLSALKFVARERKIALAEDTEVTAEVGIGPRADLGFGLKVGIAVSLPSLDRAQAEDLIATAHQVCPYSDATRGSLDITPTLV